MADLDQPLPNPPGQGRHADKPKGHNRRVSFSDTLTTLGDSPARRRRCRCCPRSSCGCQCCIWAWIIILSFLLLITLTAVLVMVMLEPRVPEVRVEQLTIKKMDFTEDSGRSYLTTELNFLLATANANSKIGFVLDHIVVSVSSLYTSVGQNTMPAFELGPGNVAIMQVHTKLSNLQLDDATGENMRIGLEKEDLILGVEISCVARAKIRGWLSTSFPVMVRCSKLHWPQIAKGIEHKCKVNY